jgi:hypothetical protein
MTPRQKADTLALEFLRDEGPHTMPSPLETVEAIAAAIVFLDLMKEGLVSKIDFGGGRVQFAITEAGRRRLG